MVVHASSILQARALGMGESIKRAGPVPRESKALGFGSWRDKGS